MAVMALCPRVALENAAQHRGASVGAASARLFTEKCAKKASAVAAVGLAWPRAVEDALPPPPTSLYALSLCTHANMLNF